MGRELVLEVARRQRANLPIVMSTVEAETNFRNVRGAYNADSAAWGVGFGQVHPAWHAADVRDVASRLRITLPDNFGAVPWQANNQVWDRYKRREPAAIAVRQVIDMILANDRFSAELSVQVIQKIWVASGQDFDRFVRAYVGPGIPARDIERRRRKLEQWRQRLAQASAAPTPAAAAPVAPTPAAATQALPAGTSAAVGLAILALAVAWQRGKLLDIEREDAQAAVGHLRDLADDI